MNPFARLAFSLVALCLAGCAALPPNTQKDPRDPFERVNRATFTFNEALDRRIAKPIARGYKRVTPDPVETGVSNFFSNAAYPTVLVNNLLQGKVKDALSDTGRLLLNTTLGLGGILDPASAAGLARNDEDFGQTLGRWGVRSGAYVMLPLLGPYTVRDGFGSLLDEFTEPRQYLKDDGARLSLWAAVQLEKRARLLEADAVLAQAGDRYVFVRSAYLQRREYQVRDGDVPVDESLEQEFEDELEAEPDAGEPDSEPVGEPSAQLRSG
jgi:phospholipid-binding lipoprotein MlaA